MTKKATIARPNRFCVVRRAVPGHGIKIGCTVETVHANLPKGEARQLADALQQKYPDAEYAVTETIFRYWTEYKPEGLKRDQKGKEENRTLDQATARQAG